jgi:hypothetical protein
VTEEIFRNFITNNKGKSLDIPETYWIRGGDGVLGSSLEFHLGIIENNNNTPDLDFAELKTKQIARSAMDTLFSCGTRKPTKKKPVANWKIPDKHYLRKKFGTGYQDITMDRENKHGLRLFLENESIVVKEKDGLIIYEKPINEIERDFLSKLKNQCYVELERVGTKQMRIVRTTICKNASFEKLLVKFAEGKIKLENRVGEDGHDHGTAFRGQKRIVTELYETIEVL